MKKINLLPLLCLALTAETYAQNQLLEIRSGELKKKDQVPVPKMSGQWSYQLIHGTEKSSSPDWPQTLELLKGKLKKGDFKKGQSLVLNIISHADGKSEKTQFYNMDSNYYEQMRESKESVAALAEIIKLSEEKGVQLGIIDTSPFAKYSQDLLKHAKGNTCIIINQKDTSFRRNQGFDGAFHQNIGRPGMSLEDVYLNAFAQSEAYDDASINTPNHEFAKKQIALINSTDGIKLTELNANSKMSQLVKVDGECAINDSFDALVKDLQKITDHDNNSKAAKGLYISSLEKYRKLQLEYYKKYAQISGKDLTGDVLFESSVKHPESGKPLVSHKISASSLKEDDIGEFIYALEQASYRHAEGPHGKLYKEAYKEVASKVRDEHKRIVKQKKSFSQNELKLQHSMDKELNKQFEEVFKLSNKYYQNLYKHRATDNLACKRIKF